MNFIIIDEFGKVVGSASCPDNVFPNIPARPGTTNIPNVGPVDLTKTIWRWLNEELVDTGQPITPPLPWLTWDNQSFQWADNRDLDQYKAGKWAEIKSARDAAEYGGFDWEGSRFDSDPLSQQRIAGAVQVAILNPDFTIQWILQDNTARTLNAQEMKEVGLALANWVETQFQHGQQLRAQIDACTTKEQVEAIHW